MVPKTTVWTNRVVVDPPTFDDNLGFFQCIERLAVEQSIAHFPVKRFAVAVFPRSSRLNIEWCHLQRRQPLPELTRDEFGAIVYATESPDSGTDLPESRAHPVSGSVSPSARPGIPACIHPGHSKSETAAHPASAPRRHPTTRQGAGGLFCWGQCHATRRVSSMAVGAFCW